MRTTARTEASWMPRTTTFDPAGRNEFVNSASDSRNSTRPPSKCGHGSEHVWLPVDRRRTVKGLLADVNAIGYVRTLVQLMEKEPWGEFWNSLGLVVLTFEELGLTRTSSDLTIWETCQAEQLSLITDNRNDD